MIAEMVDVCKGSLENADVDKSTNRFDKAQCDKAQNQMTLEYEKCGKIIWHGQLS